jgi:hypothetical protein
LSVPVDTLRRFGASLALDGKGLARMRPVATTIVVLVIAAAAVIGFAIDHPDADIPADLVLTVTHDRGHVTISR